MIVNLDRGELGAALWFSWGLAPIISLGKALLAGKRMNR
jgi:hypothetical protein